MQLVREGVRGGGEMKCDDCKNAVWLNGKIIDCRKEPIWDPGVPADHECCNGQYEAKEAAR